MTIHIVGTYRIVKHYKNQIKSSPYSSTNVLTTLYLTNISVDHLWCIIIGLYEFRSIQAEPNHAFIQLTNSNHQLLLGRAFQALIYSKSVFEITVQRARVVSFCRRQIYPRQQQQKQQEQEQLNRVFRRRSSSRITTRRIPLVTI